MREIRFRSWNGERMQHGGFSMHATGAVLADSLHGAHPIDVMQYTCLKDKNGVEIYEGDIVRIVFDDGVTDALQVVYKAPSFRLEGFGVWSLASEASSTEVIGNIYQDPELLK